MVSSIHTVPSSSIFGDREWTDAFLCLWQTHLEEFASACGRCIFRNLWDACGKSVFEWLKAERVSFSWSYVNIEGIWISSWYEYQFLSHTLYEYMSWWLDPLFIRSLLPVFTPENSSHLCSAPNFGVAFSVIWPGWRPDQADAARSERESNSKSSPHPCCEGDSSWPCGPWE